MKTADVCDLLNKEALVADPIFRDFGGALRCQGTVVTVRVFDDNVLVRQVLEEPGEGKILVVDGGGSLKCALLGDQVAELAYEQGWRGLIINGCVRDTELLPQVPIVIKALVPHPARSGKQGLGERDVPVHFAGLTIEPGQFMVLDEDGIVLLPPGMTGAALGL